MQTVCAAVIIFAVCFIQNNRAWDWCSDEASCTFNGNKVKNTMCTLKALPENEYHKNIQNATNEDLRRSMLTWHNTYRDKLANGEIPGWPKAADMRQVTYDYEMETVALRWTFQTKPGHDVCRRTEKFERVGQNCGILWNTPPFPYRNVSGVFINWVDEILLTDASIVDKFKFDAKWGHFSAVIWATTYKIGCAATVFQPKPGGAATTSKFQGTHVACNLAPQGNILSANSDTQIYTIGEPCSKCPSGTACNPKSTHPHLCATEGEPADEVPDFLGQLPPSNSVMNVVDYYTASMILLFSRLL